jgi:hypothetical protein
MFAGVPMTPSNTIQQVEESRQPEQERARGGQPANKNAKVHGLYAARRAMTEFGLRAIDGRSAVGIALREFRAGIVQDLGGEDALSTQQHAVLDVVVREKLMLDSIDAFILQQPSLVLKRKKSLLPIVRERACIAESFVRNLQLLGLYRVPPPKPTLADVLAKRALSAPERRAPVETQHEPTSQPSARPEPANNFSSRAPATASSHPVAGGSSHQDDDWAEEVIE